MSSNQMRCFKLSFVQTIADIALRGGIWTLCEYKLRKIVKETPCRGGTLREITLTPTLRLISRMAPEYDLSVICLGLVAATDLCD